MHEYASPKYFYPLAGRLIPWLAAATVVVLAAGLYLGLFVAPPDYQQGETVRIMFVHVPAAWMSMLIYMLMAGAGAVVLIWNVKLAEVFASACAPVGASFTLLALISGSLGKADVGHLVGLGRAPYVRADPILFVCRRHGFAGKHR
jgi:heme exporter protein C